MRRVGETLRFIFFLFVVCFSTAFGQEDNHDPFQDTHLTSPQRREIVTRILQWHFAPRDKPLLIPLLKDGIDPAWLPEIPNVTFRLVELHQMGEFDRDIRYFYPLEREGRNFFVGFGKGDPTCDGTGNTWVFRIDRGRVRLWPVPGMGWGTGCGGSRVPPKVPDLSIGAVSPNELVGYQFFKAGKLKEIRLGFSRREDLIKLFGSSCEGSCDYDENWSIWVNYFEKDNCGSQTVGDVETRYCPKDQYVGTLSFIDLKPKKAISFSRFKFPKTFYEGESYAIADSFSLKGFEGAVHTEVAYYEDSYGLRYEIYGRESFRNVPGRSDSKAGDLISIRYEIPNEFESGVFLKIPQEQGP